MMWLWTNTIFLQARRTLDYLLEESCGILESDKKKKN